MRLRTNIRAPDLRAVVVECHDSGLPEETVDEIVVSRRRVGRKSMVPDAFFLR